ncbi:MAG: glycosyltransferase family 4 protein [Anaerolineae bacterium]|nr:glycosyltransferase family 4 protein [Anaerolineae bacterium]
MRVALIVPGFSESADDWAIPALLNLARVLAESHELHVFSQRYPGEGLYEFDGVIHHALGGGQRYGLDSVRIWLQSSQAIVRQHRQRPFDILHAYWADEAGFAAVVAGGWIGCPVIVSLGGGELSRLPHLDYGAQRFLSRRLTTRYALTRAAVVTAGSSYQLNLGRAYQLPESKLRYAPLGVDIIRFQPPGGACEEFADGTPTLTQAASLIPVKNQALLLHVLQRVKKQLPQIKLNLAGSGACRPRLEQLANRLEVGHNIRWHGQVSYSSMAPFYRQSHLYLQTSHHESQGMAVLEAMACGVPVIGTPVGIVRDVACRPMTTTVEGLAAQAVEILSDQTTYRELRRRARQTVEAEFSVGLAAKRFSEIYSEAIIFDE